MKLIGLTLNQFTNLLSSESPAPGGGSVAALAAALSASLCAMVARLTTGREKYRDSREAMERLKATADELVGVFLDLVEKDTEAYNEVTAAFKLPSKTDAQRDSRRQAIERATRQAAAVPLETLENLSRVPDMVREALQRGNPNCLTDAGVAMQLMRAAAAGASYNVRINLSGMRDKELAGTLSARTTELLDRIENAWTFLEQDFEQRLRLL
jgi:glutamate formiminotransferase/formiminotetrahydrofolate cyclodeaminase